jgi:xanthine dehydrogenase iron-sulfur cluster and FAD-binding subunit A
MPSDNTPYPKTTQLYHYISGEELRVVGGIGGRIGGSDIVVRDFLRKIKC